MSAKQFAITDFSHYQEDEIAPTATITVGSLTANAGTFPALPVTPANVTLKINAYLLVLGKADYHGKAADLAAARAPLEDDLKSNGVYVNGVAKGDLAILTKSGYPISKAHEPVGPLAKGTLKANSTENPGEFTYQIDGVTHERGFLICYTISTNPEANPRLWQWQWSPKSKGLLRGLNASTKYKLSAVGLGTDPTLSFSDTIERTTQ